MSQHPTLRVDSVGAKHRNVLKRYERIQKLQEENKWLDRPSAFNLPKVKSMKIKVKKTKEAAEGADVAAGGAAAPAAKAGAPAAKAAPAGKVAGKAAAPAAKTAEKKK